MTTLRKRSQPVISSAWKKFLWVYACFSVFTLFTGTFINTYLIKATGSSQGVMVFNMLLAAVQPFAMLTAVWLIRRRSALFSQRLGLWLYLIAFVALGVLGEKAVPHIQLISALISAANGFFFTTYALQLLAYATDETRDSCYGLQSVIGGALGILVPSLSGMLLSAFRDFTGYRLLFAAGILITVAAILFSYHLEPVCNITPRSQLRKVLRTIRQDRAVLTAMICSAANGFYAGTMSFFLSMLMYTQSGSEALIGLSATVSSIASILSSVIYTRVVHPGNRGKAILLSVAAVMTATLGLLASTSVAMLFLFNILLGAMSVFFLNPPVTAYLGVIEHTEALAGLGGEVHAIREFWYGGGRVLGVLMTMACAGMKNGTVAVILVILLIQAVPAFLMKRMESDQSAA